MSFDLLVSLQALVNFCAPLFFAGAMAMVFAGGSR